MLFRAKLATLPLVAILLALAPVPAEMTAHAAIVTLDVSTVIIQPLEGVQLSETVASFPDAGVGPYLALVDWGDGQTSNGSISGSCTDIGCTVLVAGEHIYRHIGPVPLKVHVFNFNGLADGSDSKSITVKDAPLGGPQGRTVGMTPGTPVNGIVAGFSDANLFADPTDYSIVIDWGDGGTSPGSAVAVAVCCANTSSHFNILGTHTYVAAGSYSVTATVTDILGTQATPNTVASRSVVYAPVVTVANSGATEGIFSQLGTARISAGDQSVSYRQTVDWGDGTIDGPGALTGGCFTDGCFWFGGGGHTYHDEGDKVVTTTFIGSDGSGNSGTSVITVIDAAFTNQQGRPVPMFPGEVFTGVVGTFRDPNPFAPAGDFSASVDWGDGTSSGGTVQPVPSCCSGVMFSISGTHVYASAGPFTVRTAINDKGGTTDLLVGTAGGVAVTPSPISLRAGVGQGIGFDFGVAQFRSRLPCSDFNGPGYSATIAWGDGTSSHGGISNSGGCAGVFTLGDHHTYANGGIYSVVITIRGSDGSGGSAIGTATVTPLNGPVVNPVPVIGSMSPDHAAQNGGAFTLAISGNNFTSASLARWNGADLPTNVVSPSLLVVVVPPNDLATTTDLVSASLSVFTPAPGGGLSGALPFVISSARVKSANSAIAAAGASVTASTAPIVAGDAGVAVTFSNTATNAACVTVATYVANPTTAAVFDAGGGFVDVQVCGQPVSGSAFARFYYPSTVTGAAEAALSLLYFNGTAWSPVRGIGGAAPVLDTSDNLDATVSGGLFQVSFDATSTPALNALGGTVFTLSRVTDGATSTPTPTLTSTATATPTATATSTGTSTPTPTATSTSTPASTPTPTSSPAATSTPSPTPELVGGGPGDCDRLTCPPSPSATPELDSLLLFASGLLGIGGYGLRRIRSRRRVTRQGG